MLNFKKLSVACLLMSAASVLFAQQHKPVAHKKAAPASPLKAAMLRGKAVYAKTCITCHQADGGGLGNMNPPLIKTEYVLGDKARMIHIVLNGFKEDVEIDGQTYQNTMPAQSYLKDDEIADVLTYVRNSFGNKASMVKAADVKAEREKK